MIDAAQDQSPTAERFATQNPLDLRLALQFGVLLAVIMFAARAAAHLFGHEAVIAVAAASGLADVDAITLSVADGASGGAFGPTIAVPAVCTASAVNTVVKTVLVGAIGGWRAGTAVAVPMAAALAAGGASLWPAFQLGPPCNPGAQTAQLPGMGRPASRNRPYRPTQARPIARIVAIFQTRCASQAGDVRRAAAAGASCR